MSFEINFGYLIFGAIAVVVIIGAIYGSIQERRRRQALQALAQKLNLRYYGNESSIAGRYAFLDSMNEGDNRYAFNVMEGAYNNYPVILFDFHYETHSTDSKGHRQTNHHYFSYMILEQEQDFPELRIYPENFLSRIGQMLGYQDIDFESVEFSRAFTVRSKDKKFAYDICHTRMMEYLLNHRQTHLQLEHRCVALYRGVTLWPEDVEKSLQELVQIRELIPQYLYQS